MKSLAVTKDNILITGSLDGIIAMWNVESQTPFMKFVQYSLSVSSLALSPSQRILVSAGINCDISVVGQFDANRNEIKPDRTFSGCSRFLTTAIATCVPLDGGKPTIN